MNASINKDAVQTAVKATVNFYEAQKTEKLKHAGSSDEYIALLDKSPEMPDLNAQLHGKYLDAMKDKSQAFNGSAEFASQYLKAKNNEIDMTEMFADLHSSFVEEIKRREMAKDKKKDFSNDVDAMEAIVKAAVQMARNLLVWLRNLVAKCASYLGVNVQMPDNLTDRQIKGQDQTKAGVVPKAQMPDNLTDRQIQGQDQTKAGLVPEPQIPDVSQQLTEDVRAPQAPENEVQLLVNGANSEEMLVNKSLDLNQGNLEADSCSNNFSDGYGMPSFDDLEPRGGQSMGSDSSGYMDSTASSLDAVPCDNSDDYAPTPADHSNQPSSSTEPTIHEPAASLSQDARAVASVAKSNTVATQSHASQVPARTAQEHQIYMDAAKGAIHSEMQRMFDYFKVTDLSLDGSGFSYVNTTNQLHKIASFRATYLQTASELEARLNDYITDKARAVGMSTVMLKKMLFDVKSSPDRLLAGNDAQEIKAQKKSIDTLRLSAKRTEMMAASLMETLHESAKGKNSPEILDALNKINDDYSTLFGGSASTLAGQSFSQRDIIAQSTKMQTELSSVAEGDGFEQGALVDLEVAEEAANSSILCGDSFRYRGDDVTRLSAADLTRISAGIVRTNALRRRAEATVVSEGDQRQRSA